jgi:hypothetical protein
MTKHLIWEGFVGVAGLSVQWYGILGNHTFPVIVGTVLATGEAARLWTGAWMTGLRAPK